VTTPDFEQPIAELEEKLEALVRRLPANHLDGDVRALREKLEATRARIYSNLTPWQRVQIARHNARPLALDYLQNPFTDFFEIRGDRLFGDDASMPGGFATLGGIRCMVICQQKGRNVKENLLRNFGSPHPEGYRKALRLMRLAEKFGLPVVSLIDTPGAYPGVGAEQRHIAESIAVNLQAMMVLRTPTVAVVIGEGGSGGALGIGVSDRVLMLENAYYSVISPEGCAAILWKHRKHAPEASEALKLDAASLLELGIIDGIIPEPAGGAHHDPPATSKNLGTALTNALRGLLDTPVESLLEHRYKKFRRIGIFEE
jgi:acetyl-CoA carboxylase carboxyl transferase subunit alpha